MIWVDYEKAGEASRCAMSGAWGENEVFLYLSPCTKRTWGGLETYTIDYEDGDSGSLVAVAGTVDVVGL